MIDAVRTILLITVLALVAAACGDAGGDTTTTAAADVAATATPFDTATAVPPTTALPTTTTIAPTTTTTPPTTTTEPADDGGDGLYGGGDIAAVSVCDNLVIETIAMVQDILDALSELSFEDIAALGDEEPEALRDLAERGDELSARADELDCSDAELTAGFFDHIDELEATGPFAELILEGLTSDPDLFGS